MITLSSGKTSIYQQCPLRCKFYYVDQPIKQYRKEWPHLSFGDGIHSALRKFYRTPNVEKRDWETLANSIAQTGITKAFFTSDELTGLTH